CAGIDLELFGNDAHTRSSRLRQSLADSLFECRGNWGAPEAFTLTPGPRKPGTDSFLNHRPFELGKHAHHLKHRLTGRRSDASTDSGEPAGERADPAAVRGANVAIGAAIGRGLFASMAATNKSLAWKNKS